MSKVNKELLLEERKADLRKLFPNVFASSQEKRTCLNIGAYPDRVEIYDELKDAGWEVDLLEIWKENCQYFSKTDFFSNIYHLNAIDIDTLSPRMWDMILWWHGPEHVTIGEFNVIIPRLIGRARSLVITGSPYQGRVHDDIDDLNSKRTQIALKKHRGNLHQFHRWSCEKEDFVKFGMETYISTPSAECVPDEALRQQKRNIISWLRK